MRHATILVAILAFVPLASATAQEQLRDVPTTTLAAANSVLVFHPGQWGQGPPRSGWCRRWDPCLRGGAIGFLVGAGVGAVIGLAMGDDQPSGDDLPCTFLFASCAATEKAAIGAVVVGFVGAVIGYAIASSGVHDRLLVSVGPQRDGRLGLGLSMRF